LRRPDGLEARLAVGGREAPALAEPRPAPLELVAGPAELGDRRVGRHGRRDVPPDGGAALQAEPPGALRLDGTGEVGQQLPLAARLPDLASICGLNPRRSVLVSAAVLLPVYVRAGAGTRVAYSTSICW
jgi:hypothetical protein